MNYKYDVLYVENGEERLRRTVSLADAAELCSQLLNSPYCCMAKIGRDGETIIVFTHTDYARRYFHSLSYYLTVDYVYDLKLGVDAVDTHRFDTVQEAKDWLNAENPNLRSGVIFDKNYRIVEDYRKN